ncbi:hypothetical protein VMCG_07978 [Cytospora schulzeri]|uniref:Protein kinase domain-containing protein n=1 Tax=Cytospora schulzeri TaxID=448051 RepID=A0A423VY50_9PEZI|nr:hypothetical protein VMCG_07978 [Valsa malicola]
MASSKKVRVTSGAEMTEAERSAPDAAWEATVTKGMKETENEMILQWVSIVMIGIAVYGDGTKDYILKDALEGDFEYQQDLQAPLASCPNLRSIVDTIPDVEVFVYPFLAGDLLRFSKRDLANGTRKSILKSALTGLAELHDRGIIHTDDKPNNILLDYEETANGELVIQSVKISDLEDAVLLPPAVVKDSFINDTTWSLTTAENNRREDWAWCDENNVDPRDWNYQDIITDMQKAAAAGEYARKNVTECFDIYNDYFAPQGNVLVFVKNESIQTSPTDSLLLYVGVMPRSDDWAKNMWALENGTVHYVLQPPAGPVTVWYIGKPHYEVDHCLVQQPILTSSTCRFQYSPWILWIVCSFNLVKVSVMMWVWIVRKWQEPAKNEHQKQLLYTLGDAIASFMRNPSPETEGLCLATRCFLIEIVVVVLFSQSFDDLRRLGFSVSIPSFWSMGFGQLQPYTYLVIGLPRQDPGGLLVNVLLANLPQFVMSIMYIFYNAMMTTFLVQREFSNMYKEKRRKPLRVSEPIGIQRGSYFISLPLRYGIPSYALSSLMHWMISQSLFLARITALKADGSADLTNSFSTCGYSPIAIFFSLRFAAQYVYGGTGDNMVLSLPFLLPTQIRRLSGSCALMFLVTSV